MTYVLGLTGGTAVGKTTLSTWLEKHGAEIIDADKVARQVVEPGRPALKKIAENFGKEYLTKDGKLDRQKMGRLVFNDGQQLKKLNTIMQPLIKDEILSQIREAQDREVKLLVLDAPLLLEGHYERYCDAVAVVILPLSEQVSRLRARDGLSEKEARARIFSQSSNEWRIKRADLVLNRAEPDEKVKQKLVKWLRDNKVNIEQDT